jgi:acyl-CoA thioester hydrolase
MQTRAPDVVGPVIVSDRVRWGDVDYARIVRYDAFARFYDLGEAELLRAAGYPMLHTIERFGVLLPRKVLHAEFFAPARLDDLLEVHAYVSHVGTTSLTLTFDIYHAGGGVLCATSYLVLVCVGEGDLAKRPLPPEFVTALAPFRMAGGKGEPPRRG